MTRKEDTTRAEANTNRLLDLALLQGNRFIKELLRAKQLPIGTNKEQFEAHLREAISSGQLTKEDIRGWLAEVEGWGDQHAYLYAVPRNQRATFRDPTALAAALKASGYTKFLDAELPGRPEDKLTLATIRHSADGISFIWVRGSPTLVRRSKLDYQEVIDGEDIHFHAYERRWTRLAARFEWRFDSDLAGVFLTRSSEEHDYSTQRDLVLEAVDKVLTQRSRWRVLSIPRAIMRLDGEGLTRGKQGGAVSVRMASTMFQGQSGNVRLAATSETASYQDDAGIRQVRRAVDPKLLVGGSSDCYLTPTANGTQARELHIRLYGREQRVLLWGKMSSQEVWSALEALR
ncbi:MAG: hypothetical protein WB709_11955 [Solirubrobacteraceae bacterium]